MSQGENRARGWCGLAFAAAVYVALRALILYTAFDRVAMTQYEMFPMGTIPRIACVEGGLPIAQVYDNAAGQLLTGVLAIPSYALAGPSFLALKLVPFALGLGTLAVAWAILREHADARAASFGSLLFAVGPTTMTQYSLMASGNHFENLPFSLLALWLGFRVHARGATPKRLFAAGAAAGFALFVFLGALVPLAILALVHLGLRGWKSALRDLAWVAPGFALGVSPLIAVSGMAGARGLEFLGAKFGGGAGLDLAAFGPRLVEFFTVHLPVASQFESFAGVSGATFDRAFLGLFALAYGIALPGAARAALALARGAVGGGAKSERAGLADALSLALVLYLPATAVAYALSNLKIFPYTPPVVCGGYRYFNFHFLVACALVAIAAWRLRERSTPPARLASGFLSLASLAIGASNLGAVDFTFRERNYGAHYEGSNVRQLASQILSPRNAVSIEQVVRTAGAYPPEQRCWIDLGLGRGLAAGISAGIPHIERILGYEGELDLARLLAPFPPGRRADVARGIGSFLRHRARAQSRLDPARVAWLETLVAAGEPHAAEVVEGLATDWEVHLARDTARDMAELDTLLAALPASLRPQFARGVGAVYGRLLSRGIRADAAAVADHAPHVEVELAPALWTGVGRGLVETPNLRGRAIELGAFALGAIEARAVEAGVRERCAELYGPDEGARRAEAILATVSGP